MTDLVAFLDILGIQDDVRAGRFHPWDTCEFVNPVGIAATANPDMRFAAFSDSVVVSAHQEQADQFVGVVGYLLGNWFAEHIFARGGVALGEIEWVDHPTVDVPFRKLVNLQYARVYGAALVDAVELERSSGPGAVCFLSEAAAALLGAVSPTYVLGGLTPMLVWAHEKEARWLHNYLGRVLEGELRLSARRHLTATVRYLEHLIREHQFVSEELKHQVLGMEEPPRR